MSVEIDDSDASDPSAASSGIDCADFFPFVVLFFFVDFGFRGGPSPSSSSPSFSTPFSPSFSVES